MRNKFGTICMAMGLLCLMAAAGLLLCNHTESRNAGEAAQNVLHEMQSVVPTQSKQTFPDPNPVQSEPLPEEPTEMTVTEIDGYGYIGYLSIPGIEIELPVMDDWDYSRLKIAPCRQFGSTKSSDLVIAAHNYTRHFGKLSQLEYGDLLSFTDMDGTVTVYTVADIEILQPAQVDEVKDSPWALTLYTCTYGGQGRVVVRCAVADPVELITEA